MSEELYRKIGSPPLVPGEKHISPAKQGEGLEVLGICKKPLHMHFLDTNLRFNITPVIVRGFNMDFNISGPFLAKHKINQIHSRGVLQKK